MYNPEGSIIIIIHLYTLFKCAIVIYEEVDFEVISICSIPLQ